LTTVFGGTNATGVRHGGGDTDTSVIGFRHGGGDGGLASNGDTGLAPIQSLGGGPGTNVT